MRFDMVVVVARGIGIFFMVSDSFLLVNNLDDGNQSDSPMVPPGLKVFQREPKGGHFATIDRLRRIGTP